MVVAIQQKKKPKPQEPQQSSQPRTLYTSALPSIQVTAEISIYRAGRPTFHADVRVRWLRCHPGMPNSQPTTARVVRKSKMAQGLLKCKIDDDGGESQDFVVCSCLLRTAVIVSALRRRAAWRYRDGIHMADDAHVRGGRVFRTRPCSSIF